MSVAVILIFCLFLFLCLILGISVLWAMLAGLVLFSVYAFIKGSGVREIARFAFNGVKTVGKILIIFGLIGIMTALWRASGTIAFIVCYAAEWIRPPLFLLMSFLLNCMISFLTGTSFGTVATMGVVCGTIGVTLGVQPVLTGGTVLAGIFFGDRCSPVSTSALLVATITGTNIFSNVKNMLRSGLIPFLVSCVIYLAAGFLTRGDGVIPELRQTFAEAFNLSYITLLPAVILLLLALMRVNVMIAMAVSICTAVPICLFVQHISAFALFSIAFGGYSAGNAEVAAMLDGGGIVSMLTVVAVVCISSAYSGIFQKTDLLDVVKNKVEALTRRTSPMFAAVVVSTLTAMVACNQSLTIMLTEQICENKTVNGPRFALILEDTAVIITPLIPWTIAGSVPLETIGAPAASVLFACFLYLLPITHCITEFARKNKGVLSEGTEDEDLASRR